MWTVQIPDSSVDVHLFSHSSLSLTNLAINDSTTNKNSILSDVTGSPPSPPRVPATITSLNIRWTSLQERDSTIDFEGTFAASVAATEWSVTQAGFQFVSAPANTSTCLYAVVGRERNGVFFS